MSTPLSQHPDEIILKLHFETGEHSRHRYAVDIANFVKHMMGKNPSLYAIDLTIRRDEFQTLSLEPIICCRERDNILLPNGVTIFCADTLAKEESIAALEGAVELAMTTYVANEQELLRAFWHLGTEVEPGLRRIFFHLENQSDDRVLKLTADTPNIIRLYLATS